MMSVLANVWSFVLTLVRSLLALFSFRRRRASDPFSLPVVNDSRLRPFILSKRSIIARSHNASSARTSPKLDLGLPDTPCEHPTAASATSFRECTPNTSGTGSLYILPLTPPDRCYLAPLPSAIDCPYTESWPTSVPLDSGKPRLAGSPLKVSVNPAFPDPMVAPIGSPPPGRWSPVQIWTSTPCKKDSPTLGLFDHKDASTALATISHALITRSQYSIQPYDDASNSTPSSNSSPFVALADSPTCKSHRAQAKIPWTKSQPFPRFHHPDAYVCSWRRRGARLPGKLDRNLKHTRSQSCIDLPATEWYDADAYVSSPITTLSPPQCDSATEDEDEDEIPLSRLRERLAHRDPPANTSVGVTIGGADAVARKAAGMSPRTRRMSEGCLLAISASTSTPTRVGVDVRSVSMMLDEDGDAPMDWLEALSLRYSSENKDAPVDVVAV